MPGFVRFLAFFKTALFAVVLTFCVSNAYAGTSCPSGQEPQDNVFAYQLSFCPELTGISNIVSYTQSNVSISELGNYGTWESYFQDFRIKGRAYCSTTAPTNPAATDVPCNHYLRQPMMASIDTTTPGGTHCWCQATEHQKYSTVSRSWSTPFQRIHADYVYVRNMGDDCENSCAKYCSYVGTHVKMDPDPTSRFYGENLRATLYDSVTPCKPIENKITYYSKTENGELDIIDYVYYNAGSVKLKDALERTNYNFKGWCETETCTNPMAGGSTQTSWSGGKTLYAQWERAGCETGVMTLTSNGTVTCSDECAPGYEPQVNPFYARYTGEASELMYCETNGAIVQTDGRSKGKNWDWHANFSYAGRALWGDAFCSATVPVPSTYKDPGCPFQPLAPIAETIDTENYGENCWCKVTGYQHRFNNTAYPYGDHEIEANYVSAGQVSENYYNAPFRCSDKCFEMCGKTLYALASFGKRMAFYRSPKKCIKGDYVLTLQDGDTIINTKTYTVTDAVLLDDPIATDEHLTTEHEGWRFAGWCEDLNNCDDPLNGTQVGLYGDKTLYAKWEPILRSISYNMPEGMKVTASMPQTFSVVEDVELPLSVPAEEVFEEVAPEDEGTIVELEYATTPDFSGPTISSVSAKSVSDTGASNPSGVKLRSILAKSAPASVSEYAPTDVYVRRASSSGSQTSAGDSVYVQHFNQFPVPQTCNPGYGKNDDPAGMLDPSLGTEGALSAYVSSQTSATTGKDGKNDYVPEVKDNGEKGIWGLLFADGRSGSTVINPWYVVYGKSGCMADGGSTPPDAVEYSETNNIGNTNDSGGHCWCKMTKFVSNDGTQETADSPWVYLKTYTNADRCANKCAADCVSTMKGDNSFFRAQVFGRYSACNIEKYDITYEKRFEDATWVSEPETQYSIVYKPVTIPDLNNMDYFVFDGWCEGTTNPTDETKCARIQTIPTGSYGNKTFYARWKTTISFEPGTVDVVINNNPGSMENQDVYYDQTNVVLSANAFERTGYDFAGWNCVVDGEPESVQPTKDNNGNYVIANYNYAGNMTCTALWDTHKYYVHYYSSDTNVNFDTSWLQERVLNEDDLHEFTVEDIKNNGLTIPQAVASSAQYDFYAWCNNIDNDCSDEVLEQNANQSYTIEPNTTEDVHLYAHWQAASYNITYYLNNENYESDPPVSLTAQEISDLGLPTQYSYAEVTELRNLADNDNPGYNFIGWGVYDEEGNALSETPITSINAQYDEDDEDKIYTQPIVLVGQWEPIVYTIKYYKQSTDHNAVADNPYQTQTFTVETASITLAEGPTLEHFEFNGWYDFEDNQLVEEINPIPGKDWYLYAQWIRISCEDGYYLPERGGTCHSCSNDYPQANSATSIDDCYALCPTQIADCPANSNCEYDYTVADDEHPDRDYYHTNISGEAMPSCSFTFTCNRNYHKNNDETGCEPDTYPIIYHDGENELSDEQASSLGFPTIHTYGVDTNLPNTYDIPHYDFAGWYDNGTFEGNPVTEILGTEVPNNEQFDFYVKWDATPYHIEFLQGKAGNRTTGFTGTMQNQTTVNYGDNSDKQINYNDTVKLNTNNFDITGYDFTGWYCSATYDNGNSYAENLADEAVIENYVFDSNMVCTAQWQAQTFELTRNCDDGELADGQTATISVDYDGSYSLDNICKPRANYSITSWSCTNGLPSTGGTWLITNNSTCTANWGETSYNITYKDNDGTVLSNLTPATYHVSDTPLTVPTSNPEDTAYAHFKGWCVGETNDCTDEQLVTSYSIPTPDGLGTNIVMWANWEASACPAGKYLDSAQCFQCPTDTYAFTSIEENTGGLNSCYYNWSCDNDCPAHAICTFVSGQSSGTIHPDESYSCEITFECDDGYTKQSDSCTLDAYSITYHNVNDTDWATGANHPTSYTVENSAFTISNPLNRAWFSFAGWCVNDSDCETPNNSLTIPPSETHSDIDLYAQWYFTSCPDGYIEQEISGGKTCEPAIYTITYMDGATELFAGTFTVEDETIQLRSASKDRYIFDGWCIDTPNCTSNAMVKGTINGPWSSGNKTLYAQWTEEEFICGSGKFLHIGNDAACLSQTKQTSPALAVGKGSQKYYLKMTQKQDGDEGVNMNKESTKQINILYNGDLYNAYDDSIIAE